MLKGKSPDTLQGSDAQTRPISLLILPYYFDSASDLCEDLVKHHGAGYMAQCAYVLLGHEEEKGMGRI